MTRSLWIGLSPAGVSDFITKPLNLGLLSRRLYRLAQSRRVEGKLRQRELEFRFHIPRYS